MRFLGIDHGSRRIGLARGDELGLATPLPALTGAAAADPWPALERIVREQRIDEIVVGWPQNMDGSTGPAAARVEAFAAELRRRTGLPVHLVDERLSSYAAEQTLPAKARRDVRASGLIDSRAAAVVLQDYLDQRFPPPPAVPPPEEGP